MLFSVCTGHKPPRHRQSLLVRTPHMNSLVLGPATLGEKALLYVYYASANIRQCQKCYVFVIRLSICTCICASSIHGVVSMMSVVCIDEFLPDFCP